MAGGISLKFLDRKEQLRLSILKHEVGDLNEAASFHGAYERRSGGWPLDELSGLISCSTASGLGSGADLFYSQCLPNGI